MSRVGALALAIATAACSDATRAATSSTEASTASSDSGSGSASASASDGSEGAAGTTGGVEPACAGIDVSLVIDPAGPAVDGAADLARFFADLSRATAADLRIHPSVGSEHALIHDCFAAVPDATPQVLPWARAGVPVAEAPAALACALEVARGWSSADDDGTFMISGLMFPIVEQRWNAPDHLGLALVLGATDDTQGGMYARSGMASEAYLRVVGGGDRRRVAAYTTGHDADDLRLLPLSLGDHGGYADLSAGDLASALSRWGPDAAAWCREHGAPPPPPPPSGCVAIDMLFVIDGSQSMREEQAALRGADDQPAVLAEFTTALLDRADALEDVRVGVVSSAPGDVLLHTHRNQPEQPASAATDCGVPADRPWIVAPSATFAAEFECLAATDASSAFDEATALNAALALTSPGNAEFVREHSLVFVVMITDEDSQDGETTQFEIRQRMLSAVGDDPARLVVLSIAGDQGIFEMPHTTCGGPYGTASPGRRLTTIARSLRERGLTHDICTGSLAATFATALDAVVSACEHYPPPAK